MMTRDDIQRAREWVMNVRRLSETVRSTVANDPPIFTQRIDEHINHCDVLLRGLDALERELDAQELGERVAKNELSRPVAEGLDACPRCGKLYEIHNGRHVGGEPCVG